LNSYLYIVNPISGKGSAKKVIPLIKSFSKSKNANFKILETLYPLHATEIVKSNISNFTTMISVGGDGTLNEIVNGIEEEAYIKLGVLPIGSGNDFVKNLKLNSELKDILSVIYNKNEQQVIQSDIGEIIYSEKDEFDTKSHKFINSLGIGFDAYVGYLKQSNKSLTGVVSYLYAVIKALFNYNLVNTEINFDDVCVNGIKLMISVGNGKCSGGGFYLNPGAIINDGMLDLTIFDKVTRRRLLTALPMALINKVDKIPEAHIVKSQRVRLKLKDPYFVHCDGEIVSEKMIEAEIKIHKNRINIIDKK